MLVHIEATEEEILSKSEAMVSAVAAQLAAKAMSLGPVASVAALAEEEGNKSPFPLVQGIQAHMEKAYTKQMEAMMKEIAEVLALEDY